MMPTRLSEIEDAGEESGRDEAADELPSLPHVSTFTEEQFTQFYRLIYRRGRARAQGIYGLRGKQARHFAQCWAIGYRSNCRLFEEDGYLDPSPEEE